MTIDIDHYQETGAVAASTRGTTTTLITNVGWKNSAATEDTPYAQYPLIRPTTGLATSYTYRTYFKLSGTYVRASRVRIVISGNPNGTSTGYSTAGSGIRIYARLTSDYVEAAATLADMSEIYYDNTSLTLYPRLSTTGVGFSYYRHLAQNTTYYTQYLVTRVLVEPGTTFGNIGDLTIACLVDEYEDTDT